MEQEKKFDYILKLTCADTQKEYFWTGERFSPNKDDVLEMPNGNDFYRNGNEIDKIALNDFQNFTSLVIETKFNGVFHRKVFKNGVYIKE